MRGARSFTAERDGSLLELVRAAYPKEAAGTVKSWLEHRQLAIDGRVTSRYDAPVRAGQRITVAPRGVPKGPLPILYEDEALLAVDKPAGLLTVATEREKTRTALRLLRESGWPELQVVHRLDRETSGVLLFAKSAALRERLQENWGQVRLREYHAICEGHFAAPQGRCESYLAENAAHRVYSSPTPVPGGRLAVTNYSVLREGGGCSYLRVTLETGRRNQIRVHMQSLGHPVVGDRRYGAQRDPLGRLGLHARSLVLPHPLTGALLTLTAEPPAAFRLPGGKGGIHVPKRTLYYIH